jgi:hypothetical protein
VTDPVVVLRVVDRGEPGLRRVELSADGEVLAARTLTLAQVRRLLAAVPGAVVRCERGGAETG